MNNENDIINIPSDNIYMEFNINDQNYVVLTEDFSEMEEFNIMFAKSDLMDGHRVLRNIEDVKEYEMVVEEFNKRLILMDDLGGDEIYE